MNHSDGLTGFRERMLISWFSSFPGFYMEYVVVAYGTEDMFSVLVQKNNVGIK